jgi:aspartate aminotransferase
MIHIAKRMNWLGTEALFLALAKAKALGKKVVHLEIGEPDFDTLMNVKLAAKKAIDVEEAVTDLFCKDL